MPSRSRQERKKSKRFLHIMAKKEEKMSITILPIIIAFASLLISVCSFFLTKHYLQMEYFYKLTPKIEVTGKAEGRVNSEAGKEPLTAVSQFNIHIVEENNLDCAYLITADGHVEQLSLDSIGGSLEAKIESGLKFAPDLTFGEWEYRYFFVYLKSLDGEGTVHLIYAKTTPGKLGFRSATGIEVYGLANLKDSSAETYEGERLLAQKYVQLLKEIPEYIGYE